MFPQNWYFPLFTLDVAQCRSLLEFTAQIGLQSAISKTPKSGPNNHDSQRRGRILHFFLRPDIGQFSPHLGAISLPNYTRNLEKGENPLGKSKNPVATVPRDCRFLSLVGVERVLTQKIQKATLRAK